MQPNCPVTQLRGARSNNAVCAHRVGEHATGALHSGQLPSGLSGRELAAEGSIL